MPTKSSNHVDFRVCVRTQVCIYQGAVPKGRLNLAQDEVLGDARKDRAVPQGRLRFRRTMSCGCSAVSAGPSPGLTRDLSSHADSSAPPQRIPKTRLYRLLKKPLFLKGTAFKAPVALFRSPLGFGQRPSAQLARRTLHLQHSIKPKLQPPAFMRWRSASALLEIFPRRSCA